MSARVAAGELDRRLGIARLVASASQAVQEVRSRSACRSPGRGGRKMCARG